MAVLCGRDVLAWAYSILPGPMKGKLLILIVGFGEHLLFSTRSTLDSRTISLCAHGTHQSAQPQGVAS